MKNHLAKIPNSGAWTSFPRKGVNVAIAVRKAKSVFQRESTRKFERYLGQTGHTKRPIQPASASSSDEPLKFHSDAGCDDRLGYTGHTHLSALRQCEMGIPVVYIDQYSAELLR